jgi:hypothetical protein
VYKNIISNEILKRASCKNGENGYGLGDEIFRTNYVDQFPMQNKIYFGKYANDDDDDDDDDENNNNNNVNNNNIFVSVL